MMFIGTSLGRCIRSILMGEVSEQDVLFIVTGTKCPYYANYARVIEVYHSEVDMFSPTPNCTYGIRDFSLEEVMTLADRLWYNGKIHQPRLYNENGLGNWNYKESTELGQYLWIELIPPNKLSNHAVKDLWEKVKMTVVLTNEND